MRLLLLFMVCTFGLSAQSYTYKATSFTNGNPGPMNGIPGDLFMTTITFSNSSNTPIQVFVDRYQKSIAPYWAVCYCYIQCHSPADDTVTVDIQPFSTTDVTLQFKTDSVNPGISTAAFKMHQKGSSAITQTINMSASTMGTVGMPEIKTFSQIKMFPNPSTDYLRIQSASMITSISVFDVTGALVAFKQVNNSGTDLRVADYLPGVYFVEINSNGAKSIEKFIRQ